MIREYDANDYDLESGAGVYLSNIAFYTGVNHLVCAMKKLEGYLDASGKQETTRDKVLVVSAVMSTPLYWQEFSKEWRKALDDESIPIEPDKEHPIFHTSEFKTRQIPFRDYLGWSNDRREVFYKRLIDLVNKRTLFSTATGIDLDDYRRFAVDYPASQKLFGSAGHFASVMSFWRCRYWASKYSYDETISYIYDRDDTFADELRDSYNNLCKDRDRAKWWHFKPGGLRDEDKQYFPPIQAADLVAWEMGRDIRDYYDGFKLEAISRPEFVKLNVYGAEYYLYGYEDFLNWWHEREREIKDAKES